LKGGIFGPVKSVTYDPARKKQGARISSASADLLWKTLTPKRWALLKLMAGQGAIAIREIARRAERDVRAVHSDIHVLFRAGIWKKARKVALWSLMTPSIWISFSRLRELMIRAW
jgi:predicted transcriptional regulator